MAYGGGYTVGGALLGLFLVVVFLVWWGIIEVADQVKRFTAKSREKARPMQPLHPPAPKYHAHGPDDSIIGTFDTILDAEICGLAAVGVKAVDLAWVLHERRRLGTYGSLRDPEPARAHQPRRPAAPARPKDLADASHSPTWGERIDKAPDLRKAYPAKRLSDCRGPHR